MSETDAEPGAQPQRIDRLAVNALFPTYIYCRDHPDPGALDEGLLALVARLRERDSHGRTISNRGGWQSQADVHHAAEVRPLVRFVEEIMREVKRFLSAADDVRLFVSSAWINVNGPGGSNRSHIHGNCFFSGVYYVRVPPDSGLIEFRDPTWLREYFHFAYREVTPRNCFSQSFQPVPGRAFVFPGYLPHAVGENRSDEERVSVAFNVSGSPDRR